MAKLFEQRRIVKLLDSFYKNVSYSHPSSYHVRLRNLSNDAIPEGDFSQYLNTKLSLWDRFLYIFRRKYYESPNYILARGNRINRLYKSCLDDKFIEPVVEKKEVTVPDLYSPNGVKTQKIEITLGIRPTTKGTDLLHSVGFIEIALKKYPTPKLIVYTIIGTLFGTAVLGVIVLEMLHLPPSEINQQATISTSTQ